MVEIFWAIVDNKIYGYDMYTGLILPNETCTLVNNSSNSKNIKIINDVLILDDVDGKVKRYDITNGECIC